MTRHLRPDQRRWICAAALAVCLLLLLLALPGTVGAATPNEETLEGVVVEVLEETETELLGEPYVAQRLSVRITRGSLRGQTVEAETGEVPRAGTLRLEPGDRIQLARTQALPGRSSLLVVDVIRRGWLLALIAIFAVLVVLVGRRRGAASLAGLVITLLVILGYALPRLYRGDSPIQVALISAAVSIPTSFYLAHGLNRKTTVAIVGTVLTLAVTGAAAVLFVDKARLSGFAAEEAGFLQVARQGAVSIQGLLIAGIIISVVGVLDDVTVSQAAIVQQLHEANPLLHFGELYLRAMAVGRDHIASMVNTLVLVYTGAALPLLLLFIDRPAPLAELLNHELLAEEIVRTLVASSGLVLAVPLTTFLACLVIWDYSPEDEAPDRAVN